MPWVAACLDLLGGPILGYCLAVRRLALQVGLLQEAANKINEELIIKGDHNKIDMAPCTEDKRAGKFIILDRSFINHQNSLKIIKDFLNSIFKNCISSKKLYF